MPAYSINSILFLDIETAPQYSSYVELPEAWKALWDIKAGYLKRKEEETFDSLYSRAGIYAEFGKIICISCGFITGNDDQKKLTIKSFYGENEAILLAEFARMLKNWGSFEGRYICAHNGKEFDFPYLCRRMIINNIPIPALLNTSGKKPWEVCHLDTMDLWKFGDYKNFTSLNLLAHTLGIPSPKDDIDGSMVGEVYWKQKDLPRIATYCEKDVITCTQVLLRMIGENLIYPGNIEIRGEQKKQSHEPH
jgi:predicted PolB exonuclease-like 3'-5' exonuclease